MQLLTAPKRQLSVRGCARVWFGLLLAALATRSVTDSVLSIEPERKSGLANGAQKRHLPPCSEQSKQDRVFCERVRRTTVMWNLSSGFTCSFLPGVATRCPVSRSAPRRSAGRGHGAIRARAQPAASAETCVPLH